MRISWTPRRWVMVCVTALPVLEPLINVSYALPGFLTPAAVTRAVAALILPFGIAAGWGRWRRLARHPLAWSGAALVAVLGLATAAAEDPYRSFWGESLRTEGYVQVVAWAVLFVAGAAAFTTMRSLRFFLRGVVISGLLFGTGAVFQAVTRWLLSTDGVFNYRIYWPFFNPLFFGNVLALCAFAALWLSRIEEGRMRRLAALAALPLLPIAFASGSRSVVLGCAGALLVAGALRVATKRTWPIRVSRRVLVAAPVVLVIAIGAALLVSPKFFSRLQEFSFTETSASNRFIVWAKDVPYILERPLLGWGPESHLMVYYRWFTADFYSRTPEIFDRAHNILVETALVSGLLGVAALVCYFCALLWTIRRRLIADPARRQAWLAAGALFGYAAASDLVGFETLHSLCIVVPLAAAVLAADLPAPGAVGRPRRLVVVVVGVLAAAYALFAVLLPVRAGVLAVRAYGRYPENLPGAIADYGAATAVPTFLDYHFGKFFAHQVEQEIVTRQVRDEARVMEAGRLAEAVLKRAEGVHPWDPSLPLSRARLYEQLGKLDPTYLERSAPILEAAVARYPERFEGRQLLALVYLRQQKYEEALAQYARMLQMNPDVTVLYELQAIVLYRAGRTDEAMAALDEAVRRSPSSAPRVERIRERIQAGESVDPGSAEPAVATHVDGEGMVEP